MSQKCSHSFNAIKKSLPKEIHILYILIYSSVAHICSYQHQLPTQSIPAIQSILIYDKIPLEGNSEKQVLEKKIIVIVCCKMILCSFRFPNKITKQAGKLYQDHLIKMTIKS